MARALPPAAILLIAPESYAVETPWESYEAGVEALDAEDFARAERELRRAASVSECHYAAVYALALTAYAQDDFAQSLALSEALAETSVDLPAAGALAGAAASALGQSARARKLLALAARRVRGRAEHSALLRYTQRVMLELHFGA